MPKIDIATARADGKSVVLTLVVEGKFVTYRMGRGSAARLQGELAWALV